MISSTIPPNINETVQLREKGYSQEEIARKLGITQKAVSKRLKKAEKQGLWNGDIGSGISEISESNEKREIVLEGKKPKLKRAYRCSHCRKPLADITNVSFKPVKLGNMLREKGFTHVCIDCKIAYARDSSEQSDYVCSECGNDVFTVFHKGMILYYCKKCKALYDKDELKKEV